jgi:hypothetical protein
MVERGRRGQLFRNGVKVSVPSIVVLSHRFCACAKPQMGRALSNGSEGLRPFRPARKDGHHFDRRFWGNDFNQHVGV